jgi:fatty acid-binding protein DegV
MYSDNESLANDLTSDIKRLLPNVHSVETVKVGAVIGSHIGTNACGIAFVKL